MRWLFSTLALAVAVALGAGVGGAPGEATEPVAGSRTAVRQTAHVEDVPRGPKIVGRQCRSDTGVTVVADFRTLRTPKGRKMNLIQIGCARGEQDSGFTALLGAGFAVDPGSPFVCTIDHRPVAPPRCPPPDGYWAYSHGERGGDWRLAGTGAGGWKPPPGSLEGWSWTPYDREAWQFPRLSPSDLFPR